MMDHVMAILSSWETVMRHWKAGPVQSWHLSRFLRRTGTHFAGKRYRLAHRRRRDLMQPPFTTRPDIRGTFGAVATTHWLATQTGMAVLERGGNAFDAAAAAGFVLQIVEPHLNGPGGELPAIVHRAGSQVPDV